MHADWKTLRADLPDDVQARLNSKRDERRSGKALGDTSKVMAAMSPDAADSASMTRETIPNN